MTDVMQTTNVAEPTKIQTADSAQTIINVQPVDPSKCSQGEDEYIEFTKPLLDASRALQVQVRTSGDHLDLRIELEREPSPLLPARLGR